jgi:hypothetical protein
MEFPMVINLKSFVYLFIFFFLNTSKILATDENSKEILLKQLVTKLESPLKTYTYQNKRNGDLLLNSLGRNIHLKFTMNRGTPKVSPNRRAGRGLYTSSSYIDSSHFAPAGDHGSLTEANIPAQTKVIDLSHPQTLSQFLKLVREGKIERDDLFSIDLPYPILNYTFLTVASNYHPLTNWHVLKSYHNISFNEFSGKDSKGELIPTNELLRILYRTESEVLRRSIKSVLKKRTILPSNRHFNLNCKEANTTGWFSGFSRMIFGNSNVKYYWNHLGQCGKYSIQENQTLSHLQNVKDNFCDQSQISYQWHITGVRADKLSCTKYLQEESNKYPVKIFSETSFCPQIIFDKDNYTCYQQSEKGMREEIEVKYCYLFFNIDGNDL